MSALLETQGLGKRFGGFVALDGINLSVTAGERVGLIGPNGSGKSTLVNCMCGTLQNETGMVTFDGHPMNGLSAHQRTHRGMARSFQLPRPFVTMSVMDNLRIPLLYTVAARRGVHLSPSEIEDRCRELAGLVGLAEKALKMPRGATMTKPISSSPTISRLTAEEIVTVAICCSVPSSSAPTSGPTQLVAPPIIGMAMELTA